MGAPVALGALSLSPRQEYKKPKVKNDRPAYGVMNSGFYDHNDKFWYAGQSLYFDGEPNENLFPLNKMAHDKIQEFLDKIDLLGMDVAKKNKKTYTPLPRQAWNDDEPTEIPQPEYVMGMQKPKTNDEIR